MRNMKALFSRRGGRVLAVVLILAAAIPSYGAARKVIVLGVDGLDPNLLQQYIDEGVLPNFERLIAEGDFKPLQTSMPPLSPIAWSTFITGMDPGGHGIYDFIHRDPESLLPYLSMARTVPSSRTLGVGCWEVPLTKGFVENLRHGTAFWQILEDRDVPTTIFRMPANFPPSESSGKSFSGMGTPDIMGTPGTFSFYTDRHVPNAREISGGKVYPVAVQDDHVSAKLYGPKNPLRRDTMECRREEDSKGLAIEFDVYLDPKEDVARIIVQDDEFILRKGEWSPWIRVDFSAVPVLAAVSATGRFYLKGVRPDFELYVTPLQINPEDPAMPLSTPEGWSADLQEELGYFYTQELPEDTKALSHGIFTGHEFWEQSQFVYRERRRALDHLLEGHDEGLLFFYFSSVDQNSHMLWRYMDPDHPAFIDDEMLKHGIKNVYLELDEAVGRVMETLEDDTTLIVMSDHGFCPFYRQVNLNTWLLEKGYVKLRDPARQGRSTWFGNVDWKGTTAYAVGLNGLYVNLRGRERAGIVNQAEYQAVLDRLEADLLAMEDPLTGERAVTLVIQSRRDFHGEYADKGPDIVVGYNWGYRSSWKSPLGEFPKQVFSDNDQAWSGDHSVDYRLVPGVLIANRPITLDDPALYDLTVAVLDEYGVEKTDEMIGRDCLGPADSTASSTEAAGVDRP